MISYGWALDELLTIRYGKLHRSKHISPAIKCAAREARLPWTCCLGTELFPNRSQKTFRLFLVEGLDDWVDVNVIVTTMS